MRECGFKLSDLKYLKKKAIEIRMDILEMTYKGKGGHPGGSLSCTDILVALYYKIMRVDPKDPCLPDRDRFILSKGHSVEGYYAILADLGFIPKEELDTYRAFKSRLIGHPSNEVPGVEVNTGSLGQGLSVGVGMAIAGKMDKKDYRVYVLMGDGELAEGSIWEAAMAAAHYELDNLIGIVDRNKLQITGNTEDVMALESLMDKWSSFGWNVVEVDGNDIEALLDCFENIPTTGGKPHLVIANTIKSKGVSFMENKPEWHHKVPTEAELNKALEELRWQMEAVV